MNLLQVLLHLLQRVAGVVRHLEEGRGNLLLHPVLGLPQGDQLLASLAEEDRIEVDGLEDTAAVTFCTLEARAEREEGGAQVLQVHGRDDLVRDLARRGVKRTLGLRHLNLWAIDSW